jgi:hypothetical protein
LLALAVVAYTLAAWSTAPGFYDGFPPTAPYNWLSPPAQFQAGNQPPSGGHMAIKVTNWSTTEIGVATDDGQAQLVLPAAAFQVARPPPRSWWRSDRRLSSLRGRLFKPPPMSI